MDPAEAWEVIVAGLRDGTGFEAIGPVYTRAFTVVGGEWFYTQNSSKQSREWMRERFLAAARRMTGAASTASTAKPVGLAPPRDTPPAVPQRTRFLEEARRVAAAHPAEHDDEDARW